MSKQRTVLTCCGHTRLLLTTLLHVIGIMVFLGTVTVSSVSAQGYGTNYSDTWVWAATTTAGTQEFYVQGCGMYEESYNTYNHQYKVTTTLTRPNGGFTTVSSNYYSSGGARADGLVSLLDQFGNYHTTHYTSGYCPSGSSSYSTYGAGGGSSASSVGTSTVVYKKVGGPSSVDGRCDYRLIDNCIGYCSGRGESRESDCSNYLILCVGVVQNWGYRKNMCRRVWSIQKNPLACGNILRGERLRKGIKS